MFKRKTKVLMMLFLIVEIRTGYGMPQGFFSQGFTIPRFVSNLPNVNIESPNKGSLFNVFGKQNTDNINKSKQHPLNTQTIGQSNEKFNTSQNLNIDNSSGITNQEKTCCQSNRDSQDVKLPGVVREETQLDSKLNDINDNATDNKIEDADVSTEFITESTTFEYETTTIDDEPLNRASPQLVASLLG